MRTRVTAFLFIHTVSTCFCQSQQAEEKSLSSFLNKKNLSIAAVSSVSVVTLIDSYYMWWKDDRRSFTFHKTVPGKDWFNESKALGTDKIGHFYTSYFFYHTQKNVLLWGGFSENSARWVSSGITVGLALLIEVGDGFAHYGFDYQDLVFNIGGLGYGILQDEIPILNNFKFKWSYFPPEGFSFPPKFTDHYDGHIYWLVAEIQNLFDKPFGDGWQNYIQPAIGYSVADKASRREFIVGLDFSLDFLFSGTDDNWNLVKKTLQMIHIPAPGVKFSPDKKPEYRLFLLN